MGATALALASCTPHQSSPSGYEQKADSILSLMNVDEKIGQMTLLVTGGPPTGPTGNAKYFDLIKEGKCGNVFGANGAAFVRQLQEAAVKDTRLHIPMLFGLDVIHGFKTTFPIPLAEACSWDTTLMKMTAQLAAREATAAGVNWTYSPMVDIARDPRWGRIAEGSGEDPYLGSLIARARVHGYQGDNLADTSTMLACVKHFAAYGAALAGRDYNSVDMSDRMLRQVYLPPYKAAIDAGAGSVMTSFNELNGIPATANKKLLTTILRHEWGFDGFVVTDYTSMNEMVNHGYAKDLKQAAELSLNAGVDMDMQGSDYLENLPTLLKEGKITEQQLNDAVRRILIAKYKLGLFSDPYRYCNEKREKAALFAPEEIEHARQSARESIVLLKNDSVRGKALLPLSGSPRIALIGPLGDDQADMLGTWNIVPEPSRVTTLFQALKSRYPHVIFQEGCKTTGDDRSGFSSAIAAARQSDVVIMAVGENFMQSGEAASRSDIDLPGPQEALLEAVYATGKPIICVVMAGRPLTISWMADHVPAIVNAWHLGTMAGPAIVDVLSGDYDPTGKLVITFPRSVGQIPIYYAEKNTGRPFDANNKYTSKYLDIPDTPLYPFGYGLSYAHFVYSNLKLSSDSINRAGHLTVSVDIRNAGGPAGTETAQLYVRDMVGSVTRPVKELKSFQKVLLQPGESKTITFTLSEPDLRFYDADMQWTSEPGDFTVFVGGDSQNDLEAGFKLTN